jgi:hypothetical protein
MATPLAGKYGALLRHPATIGAITAGASLAGNALGISGENKGPGRIALEALGAGLGAAGLSSAVRPAINEQPIARVLVGGPTALALTMGAPVGNLVAGGISNIANAVNIPGFQHNQVIDPEAYGSSNANYDANARAAINVVTR